MSPRRSGLIFFFLGCGIFLLLGTAWERVSPVSMVDFKSVYFGTRCLLHHCDPYNESEFLRVYQSQTQSNTESRASNPALLRHAVTVYINLPTTFPFIAPFAALPWRIAHRLWMLTTAVVFISDAYLIWLIAAEASPVLSGVFICFFLATSEVLLEVGNTAGICVPLCIVAAWCFLRDRFAAVGVVCLAVSLCIKPQDAGFVWLYFLLAGGIHRRRALQTLLLTIAIALPAILWVSHFAPHWLPELRANLAATAQSGGVNDPGASVDPRSPGAILISLQTVFSLFTTSPRLYNFLAWLLCAPLLLLWIWTTLRTSFTPHRAWLALAAIAPLAMLPIYHRQHDARLLLLTLPALATLSLAGGAAKWAALAITTAAFFVTAVLPMRLVAIYTTPLWANAPGLQGKLLAILFTRPAPIILFLTAIFYLAIYIRNSAPSNVLSQTAAAE